MLMVIGIHTHIYRYGMSWRYIFLYQEEWEFLAKMKKKIDAFHTLGLVRTQSDEVIRHKTRYI